MLNKQDGKYLKSKARFCCLCGKPLKDDRTIEHLTPKRWGGKDHIRNLLVSHKKCNTMRGSKTWILPEYSITDGCKLLKSTVKRIMGNSHAK